MFFFDSPPYDSDFVNFVKVYFMNYVYIYIILIWAILHHIYIYVFMCVIWAIFSIDESTR